MATGLGWFLGREAGTHFPAKRLLGMLRRQVLPEYLARDYGTSIEWR
jgi:hypothetical protein